MNQPQIETATVIAENHTLHAAIDASRREIRRQATAITEQAHEKEQEIRVLRRVVEIAVDMKVYHECSMSNDDCFNNKPLFKCGKNKCPIRLEYIDLATKQAEKEQIKKEATQ